MPGFRTDGTVSNMDVSDVIFILKNSAGKELKTYRVPGGEADNFSKGLQAEEAVLRKDLGESDPLRLIRISKVF